VCAMNLERSPENSDFWERADPLAGGAGETEGAHKDECQPPPRGLRQHRAAQRKVINQASDEQGLLEKDASREPRHTTELECITYPKGARPKTLLLRCARSHSPSKGDNVKRETPKAASRVMGTGTPQRLAKKRGNTRGAKVPTVVNCERRNMSTIQRVAKS
jgi:hypothetical protein